LRHKYPSHNKVCPGRIVRSSVHHHWHKAPTMPTVSKPTKKPSGIQLRSCKYQKPQVCNHRKLRSANKKQKTTTRTGWRNQPQELVAPACSQHTLLPKSQHTLLLEILSCSTSTGF
jgi:hypothetical protein